MRKKKKKNGKWKGFSLLALIVAAALYAYQHQEQVVREANTAKEEAIELLASVRNGGHEAQPSPRTLTGSQLEIPTDLRKRPEIRLKRIGYTASYNNDYKTPYWVGWELTRQETKGNEGRKSKFMPDPDLPEPRAEHADYTHSGYDRGHMAPAADMKWSERAMEESFYMSNVCPQNQKLNRDDWGDLEEYCRGWARKYGTVYITCGPIYDSKRPKRIGQHGIAVPDRFFKAVLIYNRKNPIAMGFLFDNKPHHQPIDKYMVTVDELESITGFDFFAKLPDAVEDRIEAIVPPLPSTR